jgi:hypothetical protein
MATTARCESSKLRNDAVLVDTWIGLASAGLLLLLCPEFDAGAGTLAVMFVARSETACKRDEGVSAGFGCASGGGVPVGGVNIASMLGRNAAPKGVERKSEGRSDGMCQRTGAYDRGGGGTHLLSTKG